MSMQSEGKDAKGRNYHQITDGSTSAASMGAGATGDVGAIPGPDTAEGSRQAGQPGNRQAGEAGRTDDLLAGGSSAEQSDKGFQGEAGQQGGQAAAAGGSRQSDQGGARQ
jgi:hypothetical protein